MSLVNMLSWWQWVLISAVPPAIVLLYFLKLKRIPLEVPSTFLWRKSIEDLHVNSIWQRLRRSLLLFLQLLLVLLLIAALVRPGWSGSQLIGNRFVFLIDNSASMQAGDVRPTRLNEAQRRAAEMIEQMASGDVAMIVSFSSTAQVQQGFSDNRRELLSRLQAIRPTNETTSLDEALRVAAGLANSQRGPEDGDEQTPGSPATLYLFSDGRFPDVQNFNAENLKLVYVPIGLPEAANVGVTSFTIRRREDSGNGLQAFGRLQNFGPAEITTEVDLFLNDQLLDSSKVELQAGAAAGVVFDVSEMSGGVLKLVARSGGELKVDDSAWTAIDPREPSKVLVVSPGNDALKLALQTESAIELADVEFAAPEVLTTQEYQARADAGYYALIVYDQCRPTTMPQANTLFIGSLPPDESWGTTKDAAGAQEIANPQIIDVEATHPLMHLVDLGNVRFAEGIMLSPLAGSTVLIATSTGPLLAIASRGGYEDAVLGAKIVGHSDNGERFANTDWPLRVSFPVFVLNALNYFSDSTASGAAPSILPGQSIALDGKGPVTSLKIKSPAGRVSTIERVSGKRVQFSDTRETGVYLVEEAGQASRHFAVNLFDPAESNIETRSHVQIGLDELSGQASWEGGRLELWKPLLLAVLGVLCLEWYIYNRRISA